MMMMMVISETFMEHLFDILRTVHLDIFLYLNHREALISQIYFWNGTLHVSDSISVHQQESNTVYTAISIGHTGFFYFFIFNLFTSMLHYYGVILHALLLFLYMVICLIYIHFKTSTDYLCSNLRSSLYCLCIL